MNLAQVNETTDFLKSKGFEAPLIGIVLGTGLSALVAEIKVLAEINYDVIPGFVLSTVESHTGKLIYGELSGKKVVAMQGRFHFYEGFSMQEIAFPIRVMKVLGIKYLLLSNAAGGLNKSIPKGNLMLLDDHINLLPTNPLIGKNDENMGPRFPDMSRPYSQSLNQLFQDCASRLNIPLVKGVYAAVPGPNLETRAEYRFLTRIGADAVGMSTVPEVIAANHMQLPCAAVSVITDECDPENLIPVTLAEIIAIAQKAEVKLTQLFKEVISHLN